MRGRLIDISMGFNRKQRVTIELDTDFREGYEALKEVDVEVSLKKWRRKRSLDANAYAWVLIDKIASATSVPKSEVYQQAIRNIGGVSDIVCVQNYAVEKLRSIWSGKGLGFQTETIESKIDGCTNLILYYGSSTYDTKQMSLLIDHLVQDAKALGIETLTPEQLMGMVGEVR